MDSVEFKVQLAPFAVNTIKKRKWLSRLRDYVFLPDTKETETNKTSNKKKFQFRKS